LVDEIELEAAATERLLRGAVVACLYYRKTRELEQHAPPRARVKAQLAALEKHASKLRDAMPIGVENLELLARLGDVDRSAEPGVSWWQRLRRDLLWLGSRAQFALDQLEQEGAQGGAPRDDAAWALLLESADAWALAGLPFELSSDATDVGLTAWESFATELLAIAANLEPGRRSGLKAAREIAQKATEALTIAMNVEPGGTDGSTDTDRFRNDGRSSAALATSAPRSPRARRGAR
jgi:hypothetical protein